MVKRPVYRLEADTPSLDVRKPLLQNERHRHAT